MNNAAQQKVVQYLHEAGVSEDALVRVLQSQIAMTPRGSYRGILETHLDQTRDHASRVARRVKALDPTEALEIATYTAIKRLARSVGDQDTARLAASILAEEKMLARILREIPQLTEAVVRAEVKDQPSYDITTTGAADAVREAGAATRDAARKTTDAAKRTARQARKVPGVAQAEGQIKGAVASESDLAIAPCRGALRRGMRGALEVRGSCRFWALSNGCQRLEQDSRDELAGLNRRFGLRSRSTCAYCSSVTAGDSCPRRSETTLT